MRLPRDLTGARLVKALEKKFGYTVTRQTGSHIRLTCQSTRQHHITIPDHDPLRVGTLSAILADVAEQLEISREDLMVTLFSKKRR